MVEPLLVIDEEGRRLLVREGGQARKFPTLTAQFHMLPDDVRRPDAGFKFFKKGFAEPHKRKLSQNVSGCESVAHLHRDYRGNPPALLTMPGSVFSITVDNQFAVSITASRS